MRHLVKWAIELAKFGMQFMPRHTTKSQALTNFVAKWTLVLDVERPEEIAHLAAEDDKP